jgi:hypothetical protein
LPAILARSYNDSDEVPLMARRTNRVVCGAATVLGVELMIAVGLLGVRLKPYWLAKYRGRCANL